MSANDTIVALSTPEGEGALAILRLSGTKAITITEKCFKGRRRLTTLPSHRLCVGKIMDGKEVLDEVVIGVFRAPHSYTGEDIVEISCHGSPYVLRTVLSLLCKKGARPATAGEFTKRAFLNGKIDLSQAEAVGTLIAAETESAHKIAMQQMKGSISQQIKVLREQLISFTALLELELDFSEEDLQFAKRDELRKHLATLQRTLQGLINGFQSAQAFKEGVNLVIAGPPNVGKSTLFNALLLEEKSMVSPTAGTTRDYLEGSIILKGIRFLLTDTAGLRKSDDPLEQEGVRRSQACIQRARLLLLVLDISQCTEKDIQKLQNEHIKNNQACLLIGNKADLINNDKTCTLAKKHNILLISAQQKEGLTMLKEEIYAQTVEKGYRAGIWMSELRHHTLLRQSSASILRAQSGIDTLTTELLAAELRDALCYLGQITGETYSDAVLDHIFGAFCIGK